MKAKDLHYKRLKREGPTIAAQQPFLFGNEPNLYQMEAGGPRDNNGDDSWLLYSSDSKYIPTNRLSKAVLIRLPSPDSACWSKHLQKWRRRL